MRKKFTPPYRLKAFTLSEVLITLVIIGVVAVITVPAEKAQIVADTVCDAGIKGIWNFTAVDLDLPEDVVCENVHVSDSLHALAYYMKDR